MRDDDGILTDFVANSTPMVDLDSRLNSPRVKRLRILDFPTPLSPDGNKLIEVEMGVPGSLPINTTLKR